MRATGIDRIQTTPIYFINARLTVLWTRIWSFGHLVLSLLHKDWRSMLSQIVRHHDSWHTKSSTVQSRIEVEELKVIMKDK